MRRRLRQCGGGVICVNLCTVTHRFRKRNRILTCDLHSERARSSIHNPQSSRSCQFCGASQMMWPVAIVRIVNLAGLGAADPWILKAPFFEMLDTLNRFSFLKTRARKCHQKDTRGICITFPHKLHHSFCCAFCVVACCSSARAKSSALD